MRVLVTGGAGFIGSSVCTGLVAAGHSVTAVDNFQETLYPSTKRRDLMRDLPARLGFEFFDRDLRDVRALDDLELPDVVVHEAAVPGLLPSWAALEDYLSCNITTLRTVLEFARQGSACHVVLASTSSVYGSSCVGDESLPLRPVSPYGVTKLAAEHLLNAYRQTFGISGSILRYFSVYGPRQRPDMAYARFCALLKSRSPLPIAGDGTQTRSMTYIDDIVAATVLAAEKQLDGETLNIAGGQEISVLDVVSILADEMGVEPVLEFGQWRPGDQVRTCGDASRAQEILGWTPQTSVEQGLRAQARQALEGLS